MNTSRNWGGQIHEDMPVKERRKLFQVYFPQVDTKLGNEGLTTNASRGERLGVSESAYAEWKRTLNNKNKKEQLPSPENLWKMVNMIEGGLPPFEKKPFRPIQPGTEEHVKRQILTGCEYKIYLVWLQGYYQEKEKGAVHDATYVEDRAHDYLGRVLPNLTKKELRLVHPSIFSEMDLPLPKRPSLRKKVRRLAARIAELEKLVNVLRGAFNGLR